MHTNFLAPLRLDRVHATLPRSILLPVFW